MRARPLENRFSIAFRIGLALAIALAPLAAQAYVGPGAGLSLLGALWGVLCAIGAAFMFVIMWPIRRLRRRRRAAKQVANASSSDSPLQQHETADSNRRNEQGPGA